MAFDASRVEGIGPFHDLRIFDFIRFVAVTAYFGRLRCVFINGVTRSAGNERRIIIGWVMMAIPAGKTVC